MKVSRSWMVGGAVYVFAVTTLVGGYEFGPEGRPRETLATVLTLSTFPPGFALIGVYPAMAIGFLLQTVAGVLDGDPAVHGVVVATTLAGAMAAAVANVYPAWLVMQVTSRGVVSAGAEATPSLP